MNEREDNTVTNDDTAEGDTAAYQRGFIDGRLEGHHEGYAEGQRQKASVLGDRTAHDS